MQLNPGQLRKVSCLDRRFGGVDTLWLCDQGHRVQSFQTHCVDFEVREGR